MKKLPFDCKFPVIRFCACTPPRIRKNAKSKNRCFIYCLNSKEGIAKVGFGEMFLCFYVMKMVGYGQKKREAPRKSERLANIGLFSTKRRAIISRQKYRRGCCRSYRCLVGAVGAVFVFVGHHQIRRLVPNQSNHPFRLAAHFG